MSRFTPLDALTLTPDQVRVVDDVRAGKRGTVPANVVAWLASPELARRAAHLGEFVRYETSLLPRQSELAILAVARRWSCAYEWAVHAWEAARAGLPAEVIDAIAEGTAVHLSDPADAAVYAFAVELARTGRTSDDLYARTHTVLGERAVTDLVAVVGYYTLVAFTLNAREVPAPPGSPRLPALD